MNMTISVLLVEDDNYKRDAILSVVPENFECSVEQSVATAVRRLSRDRFDLIILDMALPNYEKKDNAASGSSQPQGGVDVLRELKYLKLDSKVIIVSQYPGIEIDGEFVSLNESVETLNSRYGVSVLGAVVYDFEDDSWVADFNRILIRE